MLTRQEWDMIARCVHCHPPSITTEEANDLIKKLSKTVEELEQLKRLSIKIHDNNNAGAVNMKIIIFLSLIKFIIKNELLF